MKELQKIFFTCFIALTLLLSTSCKKRIQLHFDNTSSVPTIQGHTTNQSPADSSVLQFDFLQAKLRATAVLNGSAQTFNTQLRWQKNQKIWMSMSLFGIEGVRVLLDSSGVQWLDRLNKEYHFIPIANLSSKINADLDFQSIERLLLGLPIISQDTLLKVGGSNDKWLILKSSPKSSMQISESYDIVNKMLIEYMVRDSIERRNLLARYGDVRLVNNKFFSFERLIDISQGNSNFNLQMKFTDVKIVPNLDFPFDIPDNYKKYLY